MQELGEPRDPFTSRRWMVYVIGGRSCPLFGGPCVQAGHSRHEGSSGPSPASTTSSRSAAALNYRVYKGRGASTEEFMFLPPLAAAPLRTRLGMARLSVWRANTHQGRAGPGWARRGQYTKQVQKCSWAWPGQLEHRLAVEAWPATLRGKPSHSTVGSTRTTVATFTHSFAETVPGLGRTHASAETAGMGGGIRYIGQGVPASACSKAGPVNGRM